MMTHPGHPGFSRMTGTATCMICHAPLAVHEVRLGVGNVCRRADCRWRYAVLQQHRQICRICGCPLSLPEKASGICAAADCHRQAVARQAHEGYERRIQQERQLREQAEQLREQIICRFGIGEPDTFSLAVIPGVVHRMTRLPAKRRREFRDQLWALIDEAMERPVAPVDAPEPASASELAQEARLHAASINACACCQGSCCLGGAYTCAYLDVETLQQYRARHPAQSPRQILAAYLQYIGKETCEGGCVYQGAAGCRLPRALRANICNEFYCGGLREFRAWVPPTGPVRAFFVAIGGDVIHRAALVDEEQMLVTAAPPPLAD